MEVTGFLRKHFKYISKSITDCGSNAAVVGKISKRALALFNLDKI